MVDTEVPHRTLVSTATLLGLVALLVIGVVVGFNALFQPLGDDTDLTIEPTCTPQTVGPGDRLRSTQVTVSVYNASPRQGLASQTLEELLDRGFNAGDTGNAPTDASLRFVQVWATDPDDPAARLVARQFGSSTVIRTDVPDLSDGIDVVLGPDFRGLVQAPDSVRTREAREVCVPDA